MRDHQFAQAHAGKRGRAAAPPLRFGTVAPSTADAPALRKPACACGGGCPRCSTGALQRKPRISTPGDRYEREADAVADQVMRMAAPSQASHDISHGVAHVQRKCSACEEEEDATLQREADEASATGAGQGGAGERSLDPDAAARAARQGGAPLPDELRGFFEPRLGRDLGDVRVHTGAAAEQGAKAAQARAYTLGRDIVFGAGEYAPHTSAGQRLLAHELVHVVQQSGAPPGPAAAPSLLQRQVEGEAPQGTCENAPKGVGKAEPEPACPKATHRGTRELARVHFCVDSSDATTPDQLLDLGGLVTASPASTRFLVHGYASVEGEPGYNFRLACHRANAVAQALRPAVEAQVRARLPRSTPPGKVEEHIATLTQSRIEAATRGPTTEFGPQESNRVAIVYAQRPAAAQPEEPGCEDAPKHLGDIQPEVHCDLPTVDVAGMEESPQREGFHFCLDSDVLSGSAPSDIRGFAQRQAARASFVVHGFASEEGSADYNRRLACHRALRVARELMRAGVRAEQVREVSSLGETKRFGDAPSNRVVLVLAEQGTIDPLSEDLPKARTPAEKAAVRDAARARLLAGQYALAADAYLSFWTCGRTASVSQAVERLKVELPRDDADEMLRNRANGTEMGIGVNTVRLSNVALRADNAIECTMGRLVDMAFHHAVLGYGDLSVAPSHPAGLHLIHLAGLSACTGRRATASSAPGKPQGIDEPLTDDPRAGRGPACTPAAEPTRSLPPVKGAKDRQAPFFDVKSSSYVPGTGRLTTNFTANANARFVTRPDKDILTASAEVQLVGQSDTFADYELGFVQAVLDDEAQVDYDSGHHVMQSLPTPIRLAAMQGDAAVPAPWTTMDAMKRSGPDGRVSLRATGSGLNTEAANALRQVSAALPHSSIAGFEHASRIAVWLVARRRGAPLDRFSVHFIDGVVYDLEQLCHLEHRRARSPMESFLGSKRVSTDIESVILKGGFHASRPSLLPADPSLARLAGPVAGEMSWFNQVKAVIDAERTTEAGMGIAELTRAVTEILDNLQVFDSESDAIAGTGGKRTPRLGFDYIPLRIKLPMVRSTGRLMNPDETRIVVEVRGPGLGHMAAHELAEALTFRIHNRTFQGEGDVVMRPSAIPGTGEVGDVFVSVPELSQPAGLPPANQPDLMQRSDVLQNMAMAMDCMRITDSPEFLEVGVREFGRAYWMDRDKTLHAEPGDRLAVGGKESEGVHELKLPCPAELASSEDPSSEGTALGDFHTHPVPEETPDLDDADQKRSKHCGAQHFIVSESGVFRYLPDGTVRRINVTLPNAKCREKDLEFIKIVGD